MKVFEKFQNANFDYSKDMWVIMNYLNSHGKLNISAKTVESLYRDFSNEGYNVNWMEIWHQDGIAYRLLEEFADYLDELNF